MNVAVNISKNFMLNGIQVYLVGIVYITPANYSATSKSILLIPSCFSENFLLSVTTTNLL